VYSIGQTELNSLFNSEYAVLIPKMGREKGHYSLFCTKCALLNRRGVTYSID
jgi:hypothetical protein